MQFMTLMGRLGTDVEEKQSQQGTPFWTFNFVTNVYHKGEDVPVWYKVTAFKEIRLLSKIGKGSMVIIHGFLDVPYAYMNKNGEPKVGLSLLAEAINFVPKSSPKGEESHAPKTVTNASVFDEDIPF